MNRQEVKEAREKRVKLVADARELLETITSETTADEAKEIEARFDGLMDEADVLEKKIEREERIHGSESRMAEQEEIRAGHDDITGDESNDPKERAEARRELHGRAFRNWVQFGPQFLPPEQIAILERNKGSGMKPAELPEEMRAQSVGTTTEGGFIVPEMFSGELERTLLQFGGMLETARVINTDGGNVLPWPTYDDTANEGSILAENTADGEQDIVFAEKQLDAYMYTSDIIKVSIQLLQDAAFSMDDIVGSVMAERIGRIVQRHMTTGTGTAQPNGVVTASAAGVTLDGAVTVTHDEILDLKHSVDPAYRMGPSVHFMFNDTTLKVLKKLKDSNGLPLWVVSPRVGEPDTLDGDTYVINQAMADIGPLARSMIYGDFSRYIIRRVRGFTLLRLVERYADALQVGFIGYARFDGEILQANAIKHAISQSG